MNDWHTPLRDSLSIHAAQFKFILSQNVPSIMSQSHTGGGGGAADAAPNAMAAVPAQAQPVRYLARSKALQPSQQRSCACVIFKKAHNATRADCTSCLVNSTGNYVLQFFTHACAWFRSLLANETQKSISSSFPLPLANLASSCSRLCR